MFAAAAAAAASIFGWLGCFKAQLRSWDSRLGSLLDGEEEEEEGEKERERKGLSISSREKEREKRDRELSTHIESRRERESETRCLTVHNVLMNVLIPPEMLAKQEGGERETDVRGVSRGLDLSQLLVG